MLDTLRLMVGSIRWVLQACMGMLVVSCTAPNPRVCQDGTCPDPAYPFCDVDGAIGGTSNACIAVSCEPTEFAACRGDSAIVCNAAGANYDVTECASGCSETQRACNACAIDSATCSGDALKTCGPDGRVASSEECALGCVDSPAPHCRYIEPRYLPSICDASATIASLVISSSGALDTNLSTTCNGGVVQQTGGPEICVMRYGTIQIESGVSIVATGARALALVSDRDLSIGGMLDVSAEGFASGPGGGTTRSGGNPSNPNGAGGAGFKTAGGSGGSATMNGGAANGGVTAPDPAVLTVLIGGPQSGPEALFVGGGGGAATLASCRGAVVVSGEIHAGGGGGAGGSLFLQPLGGAGGGAGGYVVLQGLDVTITGKLFANGGGGGAGMRSNQTTGTQGYDGDRTIFAAPGGAAQSGEGAGGSGGTGGSAPGPGLRLVTAGTSAGGGGGSVGYFQSYTPTGITPTLTPSAASPAPQPNGTIATR